MRLSLIQCVRKGFKDPRVVHSKLGKYTTDYSNLPERYIKRQITKVEWMPPPDDPRYLQGKMRTIEPKHHTLERPWSQIYVSKHRDPQKERDRHESVVEPIREEDWMWFRGDIVEVLKGPDKGKFGTIKQIVQERNWVTVEGLNAKRELVGGSKGFPGMYVMYEQPLLVTKDIKLVDPSTDKGTDVVWRFTEEGQRVRISTDTGREIPIPSAAYETIDYKSAADYKANDEKDTTPKEVAKITYDPTFGTFEMDIMKSMGIKEDRVAKKTYWY